MTNESLRRAVTRALNDAKRNLDMLNEDLQDAQGRAESLARHKAAAEAEVAELTEALDAIEKAGE